MTKENYNKKKKKYRFVKVNGVDADDFTYKDISAPVFFNESMVEKFNHIKENLYEYNGDYYIQSNY